MRKLSRKTFGSLQMPPRMASLRQGGVLVSQAIMYAQITKEERRVKVPVAGSA